MAESDKIDFSINYADTTKKSFDGTTYNGTIQGAKKILKFTGTKSGSGSGRLTFLQKGLVKLVVAPQQTASWESTKKSNGLEPDLDLCGCVYANGTFVSIQGGNIFKSEDGVSWTKTASLGVYSKICYCNDLFFALGQPYVYTSSDLLVWEKQSTPSEASMRIYLGVVYANGLYVMVGYQNGRVMTSPDGINWTVRVSPSGSPWGIAYGNGKFVVVGNNVLLTSTDGINWASHTAPAFLYKVIYANGMFVAVGAMTATSVDGVNWIKRSNTKSYSLAYGNGLFVSDYEESNDGITWTANKSPVSATGNSSTNQICYDPISKKFLVTGRLGNFSSSAPLTTPHMFGFSSVSADNKIYDISEETTLYVEPSQISNTKDSNGNYYIEFNMTDVRLISAEITNAPYVYNKITPVTATYEDVDILDFSKGQSSSEMLSLSTATTTETLADSINFAAGSTAGTVMSYNTTSGSTSYNSGNGLDCNVSVSGRIYFSQMPTSNVTMLVKELLIDGSIIIRVTQKGQIYKSLNSGTTWSNVGDLSNITNSWDGASYGNGKFIAVSRYSYVAYSYDGENWLSAGNPLNSIATDEWFGDIAYGNGKFVATSKYNSSVATSSDGLSWSKISKIDGLSNLYGAVCYGNNKFVAMDSSGKVAYSTDSGYVWSIVTSTAPYQYKTNQWYGIAYGSNYFVAINYYGNVAYSNDGINWSNAGNPLSSITSSQWFNVCFSNNKFVAVNQGGQVAVCSPGSFTTWIKNSAALPSYSSSWADGSGGIATTSNVAASTIAVGSDSSQTISGQTTITIPKNSLISDGNGGYYVDLHMQNIRLISASCTCERTQTTERLRSSQQGTIYLTVEKSGTLSNIGGTFNAGPTYGNGKWLVANRNGTVACSTDDGKSWTKQGTVNVSGTFSGPSYGNGKWMIIDKATAFYSTDDGKTWNKRGDISSYDDWYTPAYGAGKWIATNYSNKTSISDDDGITWSTPISNKFDAITYSGGKWYGFSFNGNVYSSDDGNNWTLQTVISPYTIYESQWRACGIRDGGHCVAICTLSGDTAYSSDSGKNWYKGNTILSAYYYNHGRIDYANGKWLAVNRNGYTAYSIDDGKSWIEHPNTPTITIGSEAAKTISSRTSITISSSQLTADGNGYSVTLDRQGVELVSAVQKYSLTETVDDLIDFAASRTSKNSKRYLSTSVSGSVSGGLFVCSSGSGTLSITRPGSIELTIAPAPGFAASTFAFTSGPDTVSKTISGRQTLTIPFASMTKSGSSSSIGFSMSNIALIKAKFLKDPDAELEYQKIEKPKNSRPVDFSVSSGGKPSSNSSSVAFGETASALGKAGVEYDANLGYWVTKNSSGASISSWNFFWNREIIGDFYCLMEDVGSAPPSVFWFDNNNFGATSTEANARHLPGLQRVFMPLGVYNPNSAAGFELWSTANGAKYKMIFGGFTWPLNSVLCSGGWQTITGTAAAITAVMDPNVALQKATEAVCNKLKSDFGSNIRIYVVKFRKQTAAKNALGSAVTHNYSVIDACASGTVAPYLQDVSDEIGLKNALNAIATDVKSWAGYKKAKNAETYELE
jgi:hypothetical protein